MKTLVRLKSGVIKSLYICCALGLTTMNPRISFGETLLSWPGFSFQSSLLNQHPNPPDSDPISPIHENLILFFNNIHGNWAGCGDAREFTPYGHRETDYRLRTRVLRQSHHSWLNDGELRTERGEVFVSNILYRVSGDSLWASTNGGQGYFPLSVKESSPDHLVYSTFHSDAYGLTVERVVTIDRIIPPLDPPHNEDPSMNRPWVPLHEPVLLRGSVVIHRNQTLVWDESYTLGRRAQWGCENHPRF